MNQRSRTILIILCAIGLLALALAIVQATDRDLSDPANGSRPGTGTDKTNRAGSGNEAPGQQDRSTQVDRVPGTSPSEGVSNECLIAFGRVASETNPEIAAESARYYSASCTGALIRMQSFGWLSQDAGYDAAHLKNTYRVWDLLTTFGPSEPEGTEKAYLQSDAGGPEHERLRALLRAGRALTQAEINRLHALSQNSASDAYQELARLYSESPDKALATCASLVRESLRKGNSFAAIAAIVNFEEVDVAIQAIDALGEGHLALGGPIRSSAVEQDIGASLGYALDGMPFMKLSDAKASGIYSKLYDIVRSGPYSPAAGFMAVYAARLGGRGSREQAIGLLAAVCKDQKDSRLTQSAWLALADHVGPVEVLAISGAQARIPTSESESLQQVTLFNALRDAHTRTGEGQVALYNLAKDCLSVPGYTRWARLYQVHVIRSLPDDVVKLTRNQLESLSNAARFPGLAEAARERLTTIK